MTVFRKSKCTRLESAELWKKSSSTIKKKNRKSFGKWDERQNVKVVQRYFAVKIKMFGNFLKLSSKNQLYIPV